VLVLAGLKKEPESTGSLASLLRPNELVSGA
jgi:hypothetical protein